MTEGFASMLTAVGLGMLMCVQPCPLTANIAAMSFICRWSHSMRALTLAGIAYIAGRMIAYSAIAGLVVFGALSIPSTVGFTERWINMLFGPLLVTAGMFVARMFRLSGIRGHKFRVVAGQEPWKRGPLGALLMGAVFAVSFCPVSAGLFFGVLVPLSMAKGSGVVLPAAFGFGTGFPVVLAAIAAGRGFLAMAAGVPSKPWLSAYLPRLTGAALILTGIYMTLRNNFHAF